MADDDDVLVARLVARIISIDENGCWPLSGAVTTSGYQRLGQRYAHRVAYEFWVGTIPSGYTIDHLCMNKVCVNPDHLEAVTLKENIRRSNGPSGLNAKKTHCSRGHALDDDNTYHRPDGKGRNCMICIGEYSRSRKTRYNSDPEYRARILADQKSYHNRKRVENAGR